MTESPTKKKEVIIITKFIICSSKQYLMVKVKRGSDVFHGVCPFGHYSFITWTRRTLSRYFVPFTGSCFACMYVCAWEWMNKTNEQTVRGYKGDMTNFRLCTLGKFVLFLSLLSPCLSLSFCLWCAFWY